MTKKSKSPVLPKNDTANGRIIAELGLSQLAYRSSILKKFSTAGWRADVVNSMVYFAADVY
ncbi:MAG: hypothetical protein WBJ04_10105, partial [Bacillota bacterium]